MDAIAFLQKLNMGPITDPPPPPLPPSPLRRISEAFTVQVVEQRDQL